jgi:tetrahydromethanopterin S-methyltransferase subunit B
MNPFSLLNKIIAASCDKLEEKYLEQIQEFDYFVTNLAESLVPETDSCSSHSESEGIVKITKI